MDVAKPELPKVGYGQPAPDVFQTELDDGSSCLTGRCLIIDDRLYLVPR